MILPKHREWQQETAQVPVNTRTCKDGRLHGKLETQRVLNIPGDREAQRKIAELRRYLSGMDATLDIYSMYNTQEQMEGTIRVIKQMAVKIWKKSEEIGNLEIQYL